MKSTLDDDEDEEDIITAGTIAVANFCLNVPIAQHDSILTGKQYYEELMQTENEARVLSCVKMNREYSFLPLIEVLKAKGGLVDSRNISAGQKIMVFIHILAGHTNSQTKERWQHSGSTISQIFHEVKISLLRLMHSVITPPKPTDAVELF